MHGVREGGAAAPAVRARIVDFELALAAESAHHENPAADFGSRDLGSLGRHRRAARPVSPALGECRHRASGRHKASHQRDQERRKCPKLRPQRGQLRHVASDPAQEAVRETRK
jgi:hypothetical protein